MFLFVFPYSPGLWDGIGLKSIYYQLQSAFSIRELVFLSVNQLITLSLQLFSYVQFTLVYNGSKRDSLLGEDR